MCIDDFVKSRSFHTFGFIEMISNICGTNIQPHWNEVVRHAFTQLSNRSPFSWPDELMSLYYCDKIEMSVSLCAAKNICCLAYALDCASACTFAVYIVFLCINTYTH